MNSYSDTFDYFVDDLLSSDVNLLKGELDFLLMQHLFNSIDLKLINNNETKDEESLKVSERGFTIKNLFLPLSSH